MDVERRSPLIYFSAATVATSYSSIRVLNYCSVPMAIVACVLICCSAAVAIVVCVLIYCSAAVFVVCFSLISIMKFGLTNTLLFCMYSENSRWLGFMTEVQWCICWWLGRIDVLVDDWGAMMYLSMTGAQWCTGRKLADKGDQMSSQVYICSEIRKVQAMWLW